MDIRKFFQDYFLVILLLNIHRGLCLQDDDYEDGPAFGRCPWIRNKLKNGRVRYRYKGRIAKFLCDSGYELAGKRSSTCVRGQWSNPVPVCVARGCSRVPSIANGRVTEMYRGALLVYDCNPGYTIAGDSSIHCDGRRWNASPPVCGISTPDPETHCDFESPSLCGWTHDQIHDFDWKRNQFATPSGHVGTGPSYDHTFGEHKAGYYLYIEASSPRKINDTARLFSPVYPADESGGCFTFWYHMYGATTGGIRVYLKPESHVFGELSPKWEKFGDQGNQWLRGNIPVPPLNENFQVVIEGIRGESYVGDSAIDDVQLSKFDCESLENMTDTTTESTVADSCRGRCRSTDTTSLCACNDNCLVAENCCSDYHTLCTEGNETFVQHTDEPLPGDFYGKTTSPVTVTVIPTSLSSSEVQTSTAVPYSSSQSVTASSAAASLSTSAPITTSTVTASLTTGPSLSYTSTERSTTQANRSAPTSTTFKTKSSTISPEPEKPLLPVNTTPNTETSFPTESTTVSNTTLKTTAIMTTTVTTTSLKTSTAPKSTVIISTSSAAKETTNTPKTTSTTTKPVAPSTTIQISTTPTSTSTTPTSTSTTSTSTSTTPASTSTTPASTSTTPNPTSTIATTASTTVTPSSTSTTSTTESTTTSNTVPFSVTLFRSSSSSTAYASPSLSPGTTIPDTTTPRYNLRPRKTTVASALASTYSTTSNYSTATRNSTSSLGPTVTSSKTETSPTSSVVSSTSQSRRWFTFTATSRTTLRSTAKTSTTTTPRTTTTSIKYSRETSAPTLLIPKLTSMIQPSSFATTSDSYEMVASKAESSKSNGNSAVTISVAVIAVICVAAGVTYYLRRYRSKRQSKLDDDSEMRFLPDNDYMEYSDASALNKILEK